MRRFKLVAPAALVLLVLALVAVHGEGTSGEHRRSKAGSEKALETTVRLLALRAPDPGGGAPWGIGLLRTPGGLLCAQVGRVSDGALGELGVDGALENDERFHLFARNEFSEVTVPGTVGANADCVATKETFSAVIDGLDRNAIDNPQGQTTIPLSDRREIAYGLLGPHALSITYKNGVSTVNQPVLRGLGAYLVVRADRQARHLGMTGAAPGSDYSDDLAPAGPTGFILAITYRYGTTVCRDDGNQPIFRCHLPNHPLGAERTPSQDGD
jgi:hypothetical protein